MSKEYEKLNVAYMDYIGASATWYACIRWPVARLTIPSASSAVKGRDINSVSFNADEDRGSVPGGGGRLGMTRQGFACISACIVLSP
jgi:hypothetical protein